jgi:sigma-B regulation protein RsbU (phosphoserine phosphatase)
MPTASERTGSATGTRPYRSITGRASVRARTRALEPILQTVSDGIVVVDNQGVFLVFNEAAERILGIGSLDAPQGEWSAAYGLFLPDRVTPYPPERLPLARAARGEAVRGAEIHVRGPHRPEGAVISVTAMPWRDQSGELLGAVAVFRDITAHRNADDTVRRLSNAVEQTADAIYITDRNGVVEYVNPGFERITGYPKEEILGRTPALLRSGRHDAAHYRELWSTVLAGEVFRGTMINRRKDGGIYYAEMTITPIKDPADTVTHFVAVGKDMTERRLRQEQELELGIAGRVQQGLFPACAPEFPGFDLAGAAHPATAMTGDCFDYVATEDGQLGIVIGDVSGHGLGPALVMAATRAYLRAFLRTLPGTGDVLRALNHALIADLEDGRFVTMLLARLDARTRTLTYANAGHPSGFVLGRDGAVRAVLESSGTPLGVSATWGVTDAEPIALEPGDTLVLMTDGITESQAPDGSLLGAEGALRLVRAYLAGSARQILEGLVAGARAFTEGGPQTDDLTAIICKVGPET